jgi:RNA polymerase sigma-70 factor (ECF subfamily)
VPAPDDLVAEFLRCLPPSSTVEKSDALDEELRSRLEAGRAAWPGVRIAPGDFARHIAERSADGLPQAALAADLYIACACALGLPLAIDAFQRAFRADVARAIARTDSSPAFLDDVMQALSVKLFVRAGEAPPAIAEYGGRSSLRGWLITVAKRTALNLRRNKADQAHEAIASGVTALGTAAGPEMALLKARYKAEFERSIRAALASLSEKERTLLVLHLVNGMTLPQLAVMQKVSRATVARWLAVAREALFEATRKELVGRLKLSESEYESLVALVRSQLEVSLAAAVARGPMAR